MVCPGFHVVEIRWISCHGDDAVSFELYPERVPARPVVGFKPQTSDGELLTLAVMQALLGFPDETRFLRYAHRHLLAMFPDTAGPVGLQQAAAQARLDDDLADR